mmetsp:Transcript_66284/g.183033  ORF Transcript_66284/g.183033 Transcript_66284/m.183033 type:complete len:237 (+) Transcript_66284:352-1062(+)
MKETIRALRAECSSLKKKLAAAEPSSSSSTSAAAAAVAAVPAGGHGGGSPVDDYVNTSILHLVISRGGWLTLFLMSLSLTAAVMGGFEHTLEKHIELSYFVPLLIGHGGNAGGQTVGTVLGAMASGQVDQRDWRKVITKETITGLGTGCLLSLTTIPLLHVMKISKHVSVAIMATMPALTVIAALLAAALPFACRAVGGDPTVIAAPAMTTLVDVGGLLVYFMIARLVFTAFGLEM